MTKLNAKTLAKALAAACAALLLAASLSASAYAYEQRESVRRSPRVVPMTKLNAKTLAKALAAACAALLLAASLSASAYAYEQRESVVAYGHGYNDAGYLVVHETANPGASAANHVSYWSNNPDYAVYEQRESVVAYGHGYNDAGYLVVHETANPGASAANHVSYWSNNPDYAVHYVMELDGSVVYHTVPDWALAWHVGNGNYATVGIELAHATNADDFATQWREAVAWCGDYLYSRGWGVDRMLSHDECRWIWGGTDHTDPTGDFATQWREAVAWCGDYLYSRGWGVDRMLSHDECRWIWGGTDHTDPTGYFAEYGHTWSEFEAAVETYMRTGQADVIEPVEPDAPSYDGAGGEGFGGEYACNVDALNVRDAIWGSVVAQYGFGQTVVLDDWYAYDGAGGEGFGGEYACNVDALNVRDAIWGSVVAQYGFGQTVVLDDWYAVDGGMVWGRYTAWSGATRYVAVGPWTGSPEGDDYLVKGYAQQPSYGIDDGGMVWGRYTAWSGATRYVAVGPWTGSPEGDDYLVKGYAQQPSYGIDGGWKTVAADVLNVRDSAWGNVVAQYYAGESVYIDHVAYAWDGTAWGVYTSWIGETRYVSMDWLY